MAYTEGVLKRALQRLEEKKTRREEGLRILRQAAYEQIPQLEEIDRALKQSAPRVLAAAFRYGEDPTEALSKLRAENQGLQQRRLMLLQEAGLPPGDLDEQPQCLRCRDSGWQGAIMCDCLKALCAEEQLRELSLLLNLGEQSFARFRLDLYSQTEDPGYGRSPRRNMEIILAFCRRYVQQFGRATLRNLFFHGGTGLGKTFLSACIAREVSDAGFSVVYETMGSIMARFEEQKFSKDAEDARQARDLTRKYLRCDLLIVDDLGSELTTPFVQTALYQLMNTRLIEERCTLISSNYGIDALRSRYSPQIISRLEGEYESFPFFGQDIRLQKKL